LGRPKGPTRNNVALTHIRISQLTRKLVSKLKASNETIDECLFRLLQPIAAITTQEAKSISNNKKEDIVKRETESRILDRVAKEVGKRYMTRLNRGRKR
jgi:hypothetical protein